ncbi:50S ribosomal protein L5 [bacterium]|nr:50S ribosomal protein L5 [bacterium]
MAKEKEQPQDQPAQGEQSQDKKPRGEQKAKGGDKKAKAKGKAEQPGVVIAVPSGYAPRLQTRYRDEVVPALREKFNYKSSMQVPRLKKIVLNMGVGEATQNLKALEEAMEEMALISGQKPKQTRAKVSVAAFKVRRGMPVGCTVTLRGWRMYDFLDRLISVAIPRIRDFRGLPDNAFDGRGNHNMGVREQLIFTEIDYSHITTTRGMNITLVTSAKNDEECKELLSQLGMPFRRRR